MTRFSRRVVSAGIILVAWLGGLGALARRELLRSPVDKLADAALRVDPGAVFFEVVQGGRHIGYASTTIDTADNGIQVRDVFVADLTVGGRLHRTSAQSSVTLSRRLSLRHFELSFTSDSSPITIFGEAEGDSAIRYTLVTGTDSADPQRLRTGGPVLLPTLVPLAVALGQEPKVGARMTLPVFDPSAMGPRNVVISIEAESLFTVTDSAELDVEGRRWVAARRDTVRAWRLATASRAVAAGWVDAHGRLVQTAQPGGIELRRTAYELAFENWRIDRSAAAPSAASDRDILETTAIGAAALERARPRERLRVRLRDVSLSGFDLAGGRQALAGDLLTVQRETESDLRANWVLGNAAIRRRFRKYLAPEPLLESDSPVIQQLARRIVDGDTDPARAARKLNQWVHDSLTKTVMITVPSALQVLRTRRGDCNEHTQLFLALARAAGLPARSAAGLAYLDGKFYYHAWPEVFLGTWVALDPTFGQMPADAGHLRFVSGGLSRQTELLRLMGSLRIEVLDSR
jgi:hypothetical protein